MSLSVLILVISTQGQCKTLCVKEYDETQLYKKCGFKSTANFERVVSRDIVVASEPLTVSVYGKTKGNATHGNTYAFPLAMQSKPLFGSCVVVCMHTITHVYVPCTVHIWDNICTQLSIVPEPIQIKEKEKAKAKSNHSTVPAIATSASATVPKGTFGDFHSELVEEEYIYAME